MRMVLKCKEFGSGFFKGIDQDITRFLKDNKIKRKQLITVNYSTNAVGTYAIIVYETQQFKKNLTLLI